MSERASYHWDKPRLYLHFGFATCVIIQLFSSLIMRRPYIGSTATSLQSTSFLIHSYSGLIATILVLSYWYWIINYDKAILKHLFPWTSLAAIKEILQDINLLVHLKLPDSSLAGGVPGFIQGLGLLLVSLVGLCGSILFFALPDTKAMAPWINLIKELHGNFAPLMWWYVGGHGGMALVHWLQQHLIRKFIKQF